MPRAATCAHASVYMIERARTLMNPRVNGQVSRSGAIHTNEFPQFDVGALLKFALGQIDSADASVGGRGVVQAAREQIIATLAAQPIKSDEPSNDGERVLRRMAKCLTAVKDPHAESARLALMSAADMLRSSVRGPLQPEIPKVGSTDAPGG